MLNINDFIFAAEVKWEIIIIHPFQVKSSHNETSVRCLPVGLAYATSFITDKLMNDSTRVILQFKWHQTKITRSSKVKYVQPVKANACRRWAATASAWTSADRSHHCYAASLLLPPNLWTMRHSNGLKGNLLSSDQHVLKCVVGCLADDDIINNHWNKFPPPVSAVALCQSTTHSDETTVRAGIGLTAEAVWGMKLYFF